MVVVPEIVAAAGATVGEEGWTSAHCWTATAEMPWTGSLLLLLVLLLLAALPSMVAMWMLREDSPSKFHGPGNVESRSERVGLSVEVYRQALAH